MPRKPEVPLPPTPPPSDRLRDAVVTLLREIPADVDLTEMSAEDGKGGVGAKIYVVKGENLMAAMAVAVEVVRASVGGLEHVSVHEVATPGFHLGDAVEPEPEPSDRSKN